MSAESRGDGALSLSREERGRGGEGERVSKGRELGGRVVDVEPVGREKKELSKVLEVDEVDESCSSRLS